MEPTGDLRTRMTPQAWLICIIASIGFAFDIYELLMLPLILRPAIETLSAIKFGSPEYFEWARMMFFLPAFFGGIFGLLGGYLTDKLGRRRVLTWSILLYAFSAMAAGFSTSLPMLLFFRTLTFIGVCVEFVAAVAWLAELFQDTKQREKVLGYTQAFSSLGGLLVTVVYGYIVTHANSFPPILGGHDGWRYMLISGVIPAIPLIIIRPFLPESPVWKRKKEAGTLKRPSFAALFNPEFRRTTIVTTIIFACGYGAAFGAIQQLPQIVPGLPQVQQAAKEQGDPQKGAALTKQTVGKVQLWQEVGGLTGRILLAILVVRIVSKQRLLRVFQLPGLIIVPLVFIYPAVQSLEMLKWGVFLAGLLTVAQFSFWGNYLPHVYPVHLRGTGESFAANVGGRIIGTSFAWVTLTIAGSAWLKTTLPDASNATRFAYTAAGVAFFVYLVGLIASFWLPEPREGDLEH
ncbi:MAG: MFS transporter [Verrucomicrobiales bacterium]